MKLAPLLVLLGLLPGGLAAHGKAHQPSGSTCSSARRLEDEEKFQDFIVRVYRAEGPGSFDGCVQVLRDNQVVFSEHTAAKFVIGGDINKSSGASVFHPKSIPIGTDITGRGKPNLILGEWTGGAHCCFVFHVLELGDHVREIANLNAQDSDYAHFEDVNHGGVYVFVGWDYTFAYWRAGFAQSPAPGIVLRFNGARYELAPDLMRKPAPSSEELGKLQASIRDDGAWREEFPPPLLWGTMLDLIYSGHPDLAWRFVDGAWASDNTSKSRFLRDFCAQLATSPYFKKLRPTITSAPCKFRRVGSSSK
jgi:hypothetical protein